MRSAQTAIRLDWRDACWMFDYSALGAQSSLAAQGLNAQTLGVERPRGKSWLHSHKLCFLVEHVDPQDADAGPARKPLGYVSSWLPAQARCAGQRIFQQCTGAHAAVVCMHIYLPHGISAVAGLVGWDQQQAKLYTDTSCCCTHTGAAVGRISLYGRKCEAFSHTHHTTGSTVLQASTTHVTEVMAQLCCN